MSFDAHEEKIRRIFAGDTRFVIPRNQRRYVWSEKQWRELLGDILYIKGRKDYDNKDDINHFLGSFVLQEEGNCLEIIDGQQRITTLLIIISAIAVCFNELKDEEEFGKTRQNLIGNIGLKSQFSRMKNDNIKNIAIILETVSEYRKNLEGKNLLDKTFLCNNDNGNKSIVNCFYFFYNALKPYNSNELIKIRDIILDMKVIHIASEDELDCYDIFEILNARGVDLEESELLKNFIFKYAQPKYSVDRAKEIWNKIENNMEMCNGNMEQFLAYFVSYRYYKPTKEEGVFRIVKSNIDKGSVNQLLDDLYKMSEKYIWFYHPDKCEDEELKKCFEFYKIVNHRQFRPLFMAIFESNEKGILDTKQMKNLCKFLKNFSFAFTLVMGNASNLIDKRIHKISQKIYEEENKLNIQEIKNELMTYYPSYENYENAFLRLGVSNKNKLFDNSNYKRRIYYILKEMEAYKQKTKELQCNIMECNIEHIKNDSEVDDNACKIGNLLLISEYINNKMGNADFKTKKELLKNSKLEMVKNFIKYYGKEDEWTDELIIDRTKKLARLSYEEIWNIDQR